MDIMYNCLKTIQASYQEFAENLQPRDRLIVQFIMTIMWFIMPIVRIIIPSGLSGTMSSEFGGSPSATGRSALKHAGRWGQLHGRDAWLQNLFSMFIELLSITK